MLAEFFSPDQLAILTQIILIDLVLAGDNAIIIGMVASKFPVEQRKKVIFLGNWWCNYLKSNSNSFNRLSSTNTWS
jgi:predicted tellurium resistance membrane protein TerC